MVIHCGMPKTVEAYYQQTGRAGRDGLPAKCVMLFSRADAARQRRRVNLAKHGGCPSVPYSSGAVAGHKVELARHGLICIFAKFAVNMFCPLWVYPPCPNSSPFAVYVRYSRPQLAPMGSLCHLRGV